MRRTIRRDNGGVALFPFLAVLICTMGSLIVLLVLLVQQARVDARSLAKGPQAADPGDPDLTQQLEDARFRRELLEDSRRQTAEQLAEGRAKLAHLEDHLRRLSERARELMQRAQEIDEGRQLNSGDRAAAAEELGRLEAEIARAQAELEKARTEQSAAEQWFALIPYEGPNQTRRRPIYIECTAEGIVLQPEGIVFRAEDFDGPLGPGNPLDAALRTVREHLSRSGGNSAGEPYPLLVVRPSGVVAYSAARAALKSWDDEFGYELVEDGKQLAYGDPDPALAGALRQSVTIARQRQAAMAAMMPRRYANDQPLTSFAPEDALAERGASPLRSGRGIGSGEGEYGSGLGGAAGGSGYAPGADRNGAAQAGNSPSAAANAANAAGSPGSRGAAGQSGGAAGPYSPTASGQFQFPANGASSGGSAAAAPAAAAQGNPQGGPTLGGQAAAEPRQATDAFNPARRPAVGQSSPQDSSATQSAGSQTKPAPAGARSQAAGSGRGRGSNWALPGASRHATAITRPIYLTALPDRLVLVPERGDSRAPQTIRISPEMTAQEVDALVGAIQREMKGWGLAVEGGYWKPVLQVDVTPAAEHQFQTLERALENSGFEVHRKRMP